MADYISREAALESVCEKVLICESLPDTIAKDASLFTLASMNDSLNAIPAADVVEVVRGKWNDVWYDDDEIVGGWSYTIPECSVCGEDAPYKSNYCPNCGAKMEAQT